MVTSANVRMIGVPGITSGSTRDYETVTPTDFTNLVLNPVANWLSLNPTKRPQYVILFPDVPSRVNGNATNSSLFPFGYYDSSIIYPSVSYQLASEVPGWSPFITHINMGDTNACNAYINKLANMSTNFSPARLLLASAAHYGNTNYYFDDTRPFYDSPSLAEVGNARSAVLDANLQASVIFTNVSRGGDILSDHITRGTNVAGYMSWGYHGTTAPTNFDYATNGTLVFTGNSGWYIIETIESQNGQRYRSDEGTFIKWFSSNAFGGTNYTNSPVGAVSYVDEPSEGGVNNGSYFGMWEMGRNFGQCAWISRQTPYFQAVGDPFVTK